MIRCARRSSPAGCQPGTRLPPTRELASELGIARNTVLNAFDQLYAESYIERRVGDGTYVSRQLPDDMLRVKGAQGGPQPSKLETGRRSEWVRLWQPFRSAPKLSRRPRPFRTSTPALDAFLTNCGKVIAQTLTMSGKEMIPYGDSAGYLPPDKRSRLISLRPARVRCVPEQIIIVAGSQHALEIVTRSLLAPWRRSVD